MFTEITGRPDGDKVYTQEAPQFNEVFCPEVGWETAVDGFCHACGATDHRLADGTIVYAKWAVGPAQRGSGWLDPRFVEGPLDAWTIVGELLPGTYMVGVPGGGSITLRPGQFELVAR